MADTGRTGRALRLAQWTSDHVLPPWQPGWQDLARQMPDVAAALTERDRLLHPLRGWEGNAPQAPAGGARWVAPASVAPVTAAAWVLPHLLVVGTADGQVLTLSASSRAGNWVHRHLGWHVGSVLAVVTHRKRGVWSWGADGVLQAHNPLDHSAGASGRWVQEPSLHGVLAVDPAGQLAATASEGGMLRLWDLDSPANRLPRAQWRRHQRLVTGTQFVANGQQLVTASQDGTVKLWALSDSALREPLRQRRHTIGIRQMRAADDAQWVVTVDENGALQWWGLLGDNDEPMRGSWGTTVDIDRRLAVSEAARMVAVGGSDGMVHLLPLDGTGAVTPLAAHQAHQGRVRALAFTADGAHLVSAGDDGRVLRWSLAQTGHAEFVTLARHAAPVGQLALDETGTAGASMDDHGELQVWSPAGPARPDRRPVWRGLEGVTGVAAFSADGNGLLTTGWSGERCRWQLDGDAEPQPLPEPGDRASASRLALWIDDRRQVLTVGIDQTVTLWDASPSAAAGAAPIRRWGVGDHLTGLHWSGAMQRLVTAGWDRRLALWDLDTPQVPALLAQSPPHPNVLRDLALLPDGLRAVTACDDGVLRLWNLERLDGASPLAECSAHDAQINQLCVFDQGRAVLSACNDHTLVVWRGLDQPQPGGPLVLRGHQGAVLAVAAAAGDRAVSASADGSVRLWDLAASSLLATWHGHEQPVHDVVVAADGRLAVTAGADGTVRVWDLDQPARADALFVLPVRGAAKALRLDGQRLIVIEAGGLAHWQIQPERAACLRRMTLLGTDQLLVLEPAGIRLRHLQRPIHAVHHDGARVPADPAVFGALSFIAGDQWLDARDLAPRLEWPDEPQPRQFRVRWRDEQERDHWLPRLRPFAAM
ncbi:MAG: WD40 repeat domain-containing protein [Aquabacterium sp.]